MNSEQRLEALLLIKDELENWMAYQPTWHYLLHGSKDANIAYQEVKKLIQHELSMQSVDELSGLSQSLGLYNEL